MKYVIAAVLLLFGACGGDDSPADPEVEFLSGWPEVPDGPDFEGHPTRIDEDQHVVYMGDCDALERATSDEGPWDGYGTVCPS